MSASTTAGSPRVCVVMPALNASDTVNHAAASVLNQSYDNLVLAIALYEGDDRTREAVTAIGDPRVSVVIRSGHGIANGRNDAIRAVRADFYMFLDSDDQYASSDVISMYVQDACTYRLPVLRFGDWIGVKEAPLTPVGRFEGECARSAGGWRPTYRRLLLDNYVATGTVMVPSSILADVGLFDERKGLRAEDWDLWLRVGRKYPFRHVPILTLRYSESKLERAYPRSYFESEMGIVRRQNPPRFLRYAALTMVRGRHGLYYLRTLRHRRSASTLFALTPLDALSTPIVCAYKLWRQLAGFRRGLRGGRE